MPRPVAPPSPALSLRDRVSSIKRLIVPNNNKSTPGTPNKKEGTFYYTFDEKGKFHDSFIFNSTTIAYLTARNTKFGNFNKITISCNGTNQNTHK